MSELVPRHDHVVPEVITIEALTEFRRLPEGVAPIPDHSIHYDNYTHRLHERAIEAMAMGSIMPHSSERYCGWVWFEDGWYYESVQRFGVNVCSYRSNDVHALLARVCADFGGDC